MADKTDTSKFEGQGLNFKAKLIGVEEVPEARGDTMCQDALMRLKNSVRVSGEHKQKIVVNVTLEGLKILDAISMAVLHTHAVHRISFISRDTSDNRAFGYVYGDSDNTHKFFAIKTASAAEQLVYTIRDLFQAVYNMKKKEVEEAKQKLEKGEVETENGEGNSQTPGNGSTSGDGQTPQTKLNADGENIYQVPPNNAPVKQGPQAEQVANLLDLEDQTEHILKGIEQIKNLEFDSITEEKPVSPVTPANPLAQLAGQAASNPDPWGIPSTGASAGASSALGDLAGLQTSPFPIMQGGMQSTFPLQAGFGAAPSFSPGVGGLPVTKDPFGNDPFSVNAQQRLAAPAAAGGFPAANPFAAAGFAQQPFAVTPRGPMPGMMPGAPVTAGFMVQPGMGQRASNPFGTGFGQVQAPAQTGSLFGQTEDPNLLQPMKKDDGSGVNEESAEKVAPKKVQNDLFGDLVDIKKTPGSSTADTPKDLFAKANATEKKSMNALIAAGSAPAAQTGANNNTVPQNSPFGDAFGAPQQPVNGNNNEQSLFG